MKLGGALTWNWLVHFDEIGRYISDEIGQRVQKSQIILKLSYNNLLLKEFSSNSIHQSILKRSKVDCYKDRKLMEPIH